MNRGAAVASDIGRRAHAPAVAAVAAAACALAAAGVLAPAPARARERESAPPRKLELLDRDGRCCGYALGEFRLTCYWITDEGDYAGQPRDTAIHTQRGIPIGAFPERFVDALILEGTGRLLDGRVLNYDGRCRYGVGFCFDVMDAARYPDGRGVRGRPLAPFRSVAVDPRFIPIGEPLYFPELDGIELPDGTLHDGCVQADDQGGGIKKGKIDFFVLDYGHFKTVADRLWWRMKVTPVIEEPRCRYLDERGPPIERTPVPPAVARSGRDAPAHPAASAPRAVARLAPAP